MYEWIWGSSSAQEGQGPSPPDLQDQMEIHPSAQQFNKVCLALCQRK